MGPEVSAKKLTLLVYGLQAAAMLLGLLAIVGVFVNYIKLPAVRGTWLEAHFRYQIRTFWGLAACLAVAVTACIPCVVWSAMLAGVFWYAWRVACGWLSFQEGLERQG